MRSLLSLQQKLLPDMLEVMNKRYRVLRQLRLMQPIGRRSLANSLDITERVLRTEVTFLKDQGLLHMSVQGMHLTEEGEQLLLELEPVMNEVSGLDNLEKRLKDKLGIPEVFIVPGDSDGIPWVKKEMGRAAVGRLKKFQLKDRVIAVTGGTTLAGVADMMIPSSDMEGTLFVPARGGLGEQVENQANTICAKMARKAHTDYRLLHVPDQLSEEAYQSLIEEPGVKDILEIIKSAGIVVHGIGEARTMAQRRKSTFDVVEKIEREHAVAEAFGYYFNQSGEVVHKVKTIGLQLEDLERSELVIAVAGGRSKAKAIEAYLRTGIQSILVTDEGAAKALLEGDSLY